MQQAAIHASPLNYISPNLSTLTSKCVGCLQHNKCLSRSFNPEELSEFNSFNKHIIKLYRGEYLYRSGDKFETIYIVRNGSLKTSMIDEEGREQILSFSKQGDVLGLNGLLAKSHFTESKALETSYLCSISLSKYLNLASNHPVFYQALLEKMSRRIIEEEEHSLMLITKNTKQRIATFLLDLVKHNIECGLPNNDITLQISRRDIGKYISAAVETVSRILSQLQDKGIIEVHGKHIQIKDINRLKMYTL